MAIEFNVDSQVRPYATLSAFPSIGAVKTIYIALDTKLMYVYDSGAYTSIGDATSVEWGHINGDITSQVDLQTALNAKFDNPTGNSTQYLDGSGTPTTFPAFASADKMVTVGRNSTGSILYKGTIVYISGSTGNRPNFVKAQANSEMTSAGTFGVIEADIANNADGNCVTIGTISNLDTRSSAPHPFTSDTLADGDTIYLSPTTAGFITNIKPSAPNHLVYLGKVVRTSPTNGTIVYRVQNGYELDELHDVTTIDYTTPQDEDSVLTLDSTQLLWKRLTLFNLYTYVKTYFDTIYQAALGFTPENVANKQADLTSSATKYPTVNAVNTGLSLKEATINPGTTAQYFRGDKTFQTLDKTAVELSNVDNTSDANKPVSTAQATAINAKQDSLGFTPENVANKSILVVADKASDTKYPSVKSVWDWVVSAFQPILVSGTNIKTINGSSVLGSGDITISGGGGGIHAVVQPQFNDQITSFISANSLGFANGSMGFRIQAFLFYPASSFTSSSLTINVTTLFAGGIARILIYSDVNGKPRAKLFESSDLNCATTGLKTASTTFNFVAGTRYWIAVQTNSASIQFTLQPAALTAIISSFGLATRNSSYILNSIAIGSAPATWSGGSATSLEFPFVYITSA